MDSIETMEAIRRLRDTERVAVREREKLAYQDAWYATDDPLEFITEGLGQAYQESWLTA